MARWCFRDKLSYSGWLELDIPVSSERPDRQFFTSLPLASNELQVDMVASLLTTEKLFLYLLELRNDLESGNDLGAPDGVLFNGLGPYQFDRAFVRDGIPYQIINVEPGKTYRLRVHNVGISTSLNFRIQNHNLVLVETEGSYTVQQNYSNMDIHVAWTKAPGVAILHYSNSQGPASGPLPDPPNEYDTYFSMNQARSIRWNVSAGAARPNPQGSFRYAPSTPVKLAQQFTVRGVFKLDFPNRFMNRPAKVDTSLINGTFKGFMEIIFQNNDTSVQSYHLDGYAFFVVGMDYGVWTENSRSTYNKWDGVARCTTQVFPGAAILVSLDNAGMWNLRTQNLDSWYLGQEVYVSVVNPENDNNEVQLPENAIYCGVLSNLQRDQARRVNFSAAPSLDKMFEIVLVAIIAALLGISGII
ncbi:UNVERIFIED_CONTAM: Monocopper oxidase-like protein SKU5 [Sesamum latifolium]|uniref:Monocopper oxidase-like protein SKU5 n=1 Tax=Sesamum latifolium TaxID=2727402 RepID=A0AAW2XZD9_9LAMI